MANKELLVPVNRDRNKTILGQRGDELRWFSPLGFKNIPAERTSDGKGKTVLVPNGGWVQVDPAKFAKAPDPLKPEEVTGKEASAATAGGANAEDLGKQSGAKDPGADAAKNEAKNKAKSTDEAKK